MSTESQEHKPKYSIGDLRAAYQLEPVDDRPDVAAIATQSRMSDSRIGRYRILGELGEGGLGTVFLALQEVPVRRRVALKRIKLGMDTREVIGRFEAERQALALMNHPNIAAVLDAGATEEGRPYFVMEYVPGESITTYCDKNKLGLTERLHLFVQICHAVQHAHQKGIIHRDIKPSNILVMVHDGKPVPKVIDFGVAKASNQRLTERTVFTEHGVLIGTPEYMSPEQAEMSQIDIDTRSDIYSLGVLLYELLTGTLPFDGMAIRRAGYAEIQRIIREVEPHKPSTRLSSLSKPRTQNKPRNAVQAGPRPEPARELEPLARSLDSEESRAAHAGRSPACSRPSEGNLSITPAALRPPSRALSPPELPAPAAGIPTAEAQPPADRRPPEGGETGRGPDPHDSAVAQIAKRRQCDPKTLIRSLRGDLDWIVMRCLEKDRSRRYETANGLALDIRRHLKHEPVRAGPPGVGYRVQKFVRRNRGGVAAGACILVILACGIVGTSLAMLGRMRAERIAKEAKSEKAKKEQLVALIAGLPERRLKEIDYKSMGAELRNIILEQTKEELQRQHVGEYPNRRRRTAEEVDAHLSTLEAALTVNPVDIAWKLNERFFLQPSIDAAHATFRDEPSVEASVYATAGAIYLDRQSFEKAEDLFLRAEKLYKDIHGGDDLRVADCMHQIAVCCEAISSDVAASEHNSSPSRGEDSAEGLRSLDRAESFCNAALLVRRNAVGNRHEAVACSYTLLAKILIHREKFQEAASMCRNALETYESIGMERSAHYARCLDVLADALAELKQMSEAEATIDRALAIRRSLPGDADLEFATSLHQKASFQRLNGDLHGARGACEVALKIFRSRLGNDHIHVADMLNEIGVLYHDEGNLSQAEVFYQHALSTYQKCGGEEHPTSLNAIDNLAWFYKVKGDDVYRRLAANGDESEARRRKQQEYDKANTAFRRLIQLRTRVQGANHRLVAEAKRDLGRCFQDGGDLLEAEKQFRESEDVYRSLPNSARDQRKLALCLNDHAKMLRNKGALSAAEPLFREAVAIRSTVEGLDHVDTVDSQLGLCKCLMLQKSFSAAEETIRDCWEHAKPGTKLHESRARDVIEVTVSLYAAWYNAEPGKGYDMQARAWKARLDELQAAKQAATAPAGK